MLKKKLPRKQILTFFANHPQCLVGMESCATSAYWQREIAKLGHTVKRIHARFVKPYLMADKNDANDAAAICEAVSRPHMRFVPPKGQEQSDIQALHRVRSALIQERTAKFNSVRGLLAENGIIIAKGAAHVRTHLPLILDDYENALSATVRILLRKQLDLIDVLDEQLNELDGMVKTLVKEREECSRLKEIPGVGDLTATILAAVLGNGNNFKNGRQFAAYLGLVPRQHSTGGKSRMMGITKRGDTYIRTLLISGARAVLASFSRGRKPLKEKTQWLEDIYIRRGHNIACVALANKMARIAWSLITHQTSYRPTI